MGKFPAILGLTLFVLSQASFAEMRTVEREGCVGLGEKDSMETLRASARQVAERSISEQALLIDGKSIVQNFQLKDDVIRSRVKAELIDLVQVGKAQIVDNQLCIRMAAKIDMEQVRRDLEREKERLDRLRKAEEQAELATAIRGQTPIQANNSDVQIDRVSQLGKCRNPVDVSLTTDGQVKMRFCEIPAGRAAIGSENGESNERPVKTRTFKSFQMGQFTVTQGQYKAVLSEEPWKTNGKLNDYVQEGDNNPAVYVSYIEVQRFAQMMNMVDPSATYRLPTEAEFEYAARAGSTTDYYWGDDIDPSYAYYSENTNDGKYAHDVTFCPAPVLDKKYPGYCANNFGLMHMSGNVWQWTADAYVNTYENAPTDGNMAVVGLARSPRVIRGGSWGTVAYFLRSAGRLSSPGDRSRTVGLRLVRIPHLMPKISSLPDVQVE